MRGGRGAEGSRGGRGATDAIIASGREWDSYRKASSRYLWGAIPANLVGNATTPLGGATNVLRAYPMVFPVRGTINLLQFWSDSSGVSLNNPDGQYIRLGIWANALDADPLPGTLLWDSGLLDLKKPGFADSTWTLDPNITTGPNKLLWLSWIIAPEVLDATPDPPTLISYQAGQILGRNVVGYKNTILMPGRVQSSTSGDSTAPVGTMNAGFGIGHALAQFPVTGLPAQFPTSAITRIGQGAGGGSYDSAWAPQFWFRFDAS